MIAIGMDISARASATWHASPSVCVILLRVAASAGAKLRRCHIEFVAVAGTRILHSTFVVCLGLSTLAVKQASLLVRGRARTI